MSILKQKVKMDLTRNIEILGNTTQDKIKKEHPCVIGVGGVGGYVIEMLVRLGVKKITIIDFDVYDTTNINRQIGCTQQTIGDLKTTTIYNRIKQINPECDVTIINERITIENIDEYNFKEVTIFFNTIDGIENKCHITDYISNTLNKNIIFSNCCQYNIFNVLLSSNSQTTVKSLFYNSDGIFIHNKVDNIASPSSVVITTSTISIQLFLNYLIYNIYDIVVSMDMQNFKVINTDICSYIRYYLSKNND